MARQGTKFIFVTGGVLSGLGKGITAASLGNILKSRGLKVNIQKCDPYINTDAGTLNPAEHGEVFVTADGAETDLDLGHYERFLGQELTYKSSLMSGRVYARVIADERAGKYLGKTVQIIPHFTGEVQRAIAESGRGFDVHIVEIGGTVGDYESLGFLESIRQFRRQVGHENVLYLHVVYLPYLEASRELKTKPAQNTVRDLRAAGIQPDIIVARAERPVSDSLIAKLSLYCDVEPKAIVALPTAETVYEVPLLLEASGIGNYVVKRLGLTRARPKLGEWRELVTTIKSRGDRPIVRIGIVAKYLDNYDTYMSVFEAIKAAAWQNGITPELVWIEAEQVTQANRSALLAGLDGMVVPGGFGKRGVEGKVVAGQYALDEQLPYLGLCLGMQTGVIAFARRALGTDAVNSTEFDPQVEHPVIDLMPDQVKLSDKGGTMRLGNYPCVLKKDSHSYRAYGQKRVMERHRHRYEFNNDYRAMLESAGLVTAGLSPDQKLVEIIEVPGHPFFVGTQFHPEFTSRPNRPQPLFLAFMSAVMRRSQAQQTINLPKPKLTRRRRDEAKSTTSRG